MQPAREASARKTLTINADWANAVAGFADELSDHGYSDYTVRDYRSDVLRLADYLHVGPWDAARSHMPHLEHAMAGDGFCLSARRRRLSAFNRFLQYQSSRGPKRRVGPRLLRAAMESSPVDHLLVGLVYLACLRLVEVAQLEGRDIRLRKRILQTRSGWRIVPLHPRLHEIVRGLRYHMPLAAYRPILPGVNGFPVNARTLHGRFQRLVQRSGFKDIKPDTLRREASQHLTSSGTPPGLIQALLGKDRGRPIAPRRGRLVDLTCLRERLERIPV